TTGGPSPSPRLKNTEVPSTSTVACSITAPNISSAHGDGDLEPPDEAPCPRDQGPAARAVRPSHPGPARAAGRGARAHDSVPEHERHQPRRGVRPAARALSHVAGGARCAAGRG